MNSAGVDTCDQASNEGAVTLFKNFVEGVVAASLTSTMQSEEATAALNVPNRRSSRLHGEEEALKELAMATVEPRKPKKVSSSLAFLSPRLPPFLC
jgi:hypothetical protein